MNEQIQTIIEKYTVDKYQIAVISATVSIITVLVTNWIKNYFDSKLHLGKLKTDHRFQEQKKIKEAIAKYKVHLVSACDDLNHRLWSIARNHQEGWLNIEGNYQKESHYFHSSAYRILAVFAWVKKIEKEMIFLDTTIAEKEDMEFIKFLKIFPQLFCNLSFLGGINPRGTHATDHFFRNNFEILSDSLIVDDKIQSYGEFKSTIPQTVTQLKPIYVYLDHVSPNENRLRWDRLHLFNLTLIAFLNNYGYDFQKTNEEKIKAVLQTPRKSPLLGNYLRFLAEYHLDQNTEIKKLAKIIRNIEGQP
ncbi:MAG: hypothetical protein K0M63_08215 [Weeksellaceae bacterium]|nr:hypothetical protein [Weeksellaceae bacterium]